MTDRRFEDDLTRLLSAKASWRAPANLRVRVASVPEEIGPSGRLRGLVASVPRVARFAAVAFVMVLVAGSVWLRYETGSPGSGGTPLTIQTEAAPTPLPSGAVWVCTLPIVDLSLRVERSGSELVVISIKTGEPMSVVWPNGFSARLVDGRAELLAEDGTVVAREGDVLANVIGSVRGPDGAYHISQFNGTCYLPQGSEIRVH